MNILREEFCKEKNVPMGLDNVYEYCNWLEKKLTEANQALQLHKTQVISQCCHDNTEHQTLTCNVCLDCNEIIETDV